MASFNRVILVGNVTRDPEVRYIPSGQAVCELGLAVNRYWFDKQANQKKEETTFVDVTLWGREAELAGEYLAKGRPVLIEGRLQLDSWDDKQTGQKRSKLRVVGEHMQFLGSRDGAAPGGGNAGGGSSGGGAPRGGAAKAGASREPADSYYESDSGPPPSNQGGDEVPF